MSSEDTTSVAVAKDIVASSIGSCACVYTGQPFDTVKVRMQVGLHDGVWRCLQATVREEGVLALWKGTVPALSGAVMENVTAFAINNQLKRLIREEDLSVYTRPFVTGTITGFFTSFALCTSDVLKCRAQTIRALGGQVPTMQEMIAGILRTQGVPGLFTGLHAQFLRDVPFYFSFFGSYDVCVHLMKQNTSLSDEAVYFIAGGLAGQIGWAVTMPFDVIKSRIQTAEVHPGWAWNVGRDVLREGGVRQLYAGIGPAVVRAFPANSALFLTYEMVKRWLG